MKRIAVLGFLVAAIAALSLSNVRQAEAAYCRCGPATNTVTLSQFGTTCAQATAALRTALRATYTCYECRDAVLTSSCTYSGGEDPIAIATGYLTFRCYITGGCQIP